jgi:hypothetical protein
MTDPLNSPAGLVYPPGRQPQWTKILGRTGFTVDTLHELCAPPGAEAHPDHHWTAQWPAVDLWAAHLPVSRSIT